MTKITNADLSEFCYEQGSVIFTIARESNVTDIHRVIQMYRDATETIFRNITKKEKQWRART